MSRRFKSPKPVNAKRLEAVVVWRSTDRSKWGSPQEYQFPGDTVEEPPAGFVKVELADLRAMDKFTKAYNETVRRQLTEERERLALRFHQSRVKDRADRLAKAWHNPRALALLRACQSWVDKKLEARYSQRIEPNFHIQPVAFDASNRAPFNSPETGWKDRKA